MSENFSDLDKGFSNPRLASMSDLKDTPQKKSALGKGLNSLFGFGQESSPTTTAAVTGVGADRAAKTNAVFRIDVTDIEPNPHQPRKIFSDEELSSLAASIKEDGVIQPIIVTKGTKPGSYVLVAGERRWRASKQAGLETIPAIVKEGSPDAMLRWALIENIQRADLSIIEEAEAYHSLINDFGLSQEQCATKVGKDRSTVANAVRLLSLPREIQDDLLERRLTMGHGRALLTIEDKRVMLRARDIVLKKSLSVRQTEQLCKNLKRNPEQSERADADVNPDIEYLADALRNHLRTKVKLAGDANKGRIEISYFSAAELERLMSVLGVKLS